MRQRAIPLLLSLASPVLGQATHQVMVGVKGSFYDPPTTSALKGDILQFIFGGIFHGVTQSTFDNPCMPLEGGFSSGLQGTMGELNVTEDPPVWNLIITNASAPIWFFCQATQPENHCAQGMVGAINAPPDMFANFTSAAKAFVPGPTLAPIVTALSGIGASATAAPAPTAVPTSSSSSASVTSASDGSFTPSPTNATPATTSTGSSKSGINAGVIGGAVGGGAALVVIGILAYLLLRKKASNPPATYVETSERIPFPDPKPGWSSPDSSILRTKPGVMSYEQSGRQASRQGSRNALQSSNLGRNESYSASSERSSASPLMNNERELPSQLRYVQSRGDMQSLTMADALTSHPYAHALAPVPAPVAPLPKRPEPPLGHGAVLERGPDVNVHELAKEVAAILHPQNPTPSPPPQPLTTMPSLRAPPPRPPRHLPNPRSFNFGQGVRSPEPDTSLPQYER